MKNIIIILICGLFLTNCSNRYVWGTKCTSPDKFTGAYEKSFIWSVDKTVSDDDFGKRISKKNCPKVVKKPNKHQFFDNNSYWYFTAWLCRICGVFFNREF